MSAALSRKLASLLLAVCILLPLSKCTHKQELVPAAVTAVAPAAAVAQPETFSIFHGTALVLATAADVRNGHLDEIPLLIGLLVAFFAPAASLWLREPALSTVHVLAAFPSLYILQMFTFIGTPQYGGLLALACWALLLMLGTAALWRSMRKPRTISAA